ncbi:MAG: radical SAM protein [Candidatus Bathyarchaeum tardum]|nr:MAG: radical SAM protein [Candidatus Bathyarchaeum tardum]
MANNGQLQGVPIVLTGSATDMSDFKLNPFRAFSGGFPTAIIPRFMLRKYWYPKTPMNGNNTAKFVPYGMRKIEASLINEFGSEHVAVVHPYDLKKVVGPNTKIIGISTMEPVGIGFVSRTYTSLVGFGGEPVAAAEFRELITNPILRKWNAKIVLGGAGAWQIHRAKLQKKYQIDCIVMGEGEKTALEIFRKALKGEELPKFVETQAPDPKEICPIVNPAIFGTVEITRGCGRGCKFCSPMIRKRYSFPLEHILREVEINAKHGTRMIILASEDIFLYKCKDNFRPNRQAVSELINSIAKIPKVEFIQPAHAALAPVVCEPEMIREIGPVLLEKSYWVTSGIKHSSIEVGIETGSFRLMKKYMPRKVFPFKPEEWQDIVTKSIDIMNQNSIWPLATFIVGLPGETEDDTNATIELVNQLKHNKLFYVPLLFTSEEECNLRKAQHMDLKQLTPLQWELLATCWRNNIEIFAPDLSQWPARVVSAFAYVLYYRWKHGKKVLKPLLTLSGLNQKQVPTRTV